VEYEVCKDSKDRMAEMRSVSQKSQENMDTTIVLKAVASSRRSEKA
jgi:hypothetical protein